jgi:hypothetical protein
MAGKMTNAYKIFVGNLKVNRRLERPRHRWEDNTNMNLK